MTHQHSLISKRLREIDEEKARLDAEAAALSKQLTALSKVGHAMRDDDVLTSRNAAKFELLARVIKHLSGEDPYLYGGSSTREIYNSVIAGLNEDAIRKSWHNNNLDRNDNLREGASSERWESRDPGTPMINASKPLNYNTFRSSLSRFREEGRIFLDPKTSRWKLTMSETETHAQSKGDKDDDLAKS